MPDAKPPKKKLTKVQWVLIAVAVLVVLGALGSRGGNQPGKTEAQVAQDKADRQAASQKEKLRVRLERQWKEAKANGLDAECTAVQLYREYKTNEVRADAKYKGKWVGVSGKLASVAKGITDKPYLTLAADGYGIAQVQAHLFEVQPRSLKRESFSAASVEEIAGDLQPGREVGVMCLGAGASLTFPQLDQCIIVPDEK
jgi:hypothetical protein